MASELQRYSGYYDRQSAVDSDYRQFMEKQAMVKDLDKAIQKSAEKQMFTTLFVGSKITSKMDQNTNKLQQSIGEMSTDIQNSMGRMSAGIQNSINAQTFAIVASNEALGRIMETGFSDISSQLGEMSSTFTMGFANIGSAISKMSEDICKRLDVLHDIMNNPLLTQSRELYRRAVTNANKKFFEEALEDVKGAVEKNKTDYISWLLTGKVYLFGASEFSNVINLDNAIISLNNAAKYISPDIEGSNDARKMAAEIWFDIGLAKYAKSNDLLSAGKEEESKKMLAEAQTAFEKSYKYSNKMLEARYNVARCKVLLGYTKEAIKDLELIIPRDINYCIKVLSDSDFDTISDDFFQLIDQLKKNIFTGVKENYDKIKKLLDEINELNGNLSDSTYNTLNKYAAAEPSETEPYFDILYKAEVYTKIIPTIESFLTNLREKQKKEAENAKISEEGKRRAHTVLLIKNEILKRLTEYKQKLTGYKFTKEEEDIFYDEHKYFERIKESLENGEKIESWMRAKSIPNEWEQVLLNDKEILNMCLVITKKIWQAAYKQIAKRRKKGIAATCFPVSILFFFLIFMLRSIGIVWGTVILGALIGVLIAIFQDEGSREKIKSFILGPIMGGVIGFVIGGVGHLISLASWSFVTVLWAIVVIGANLTAIFFDDL